MFFVKSVAKVSDYIVNTKSAFVFLTKPPHGRASLRFFGRAEKGIGFHATIRADDRGCHTPFLPAKAGAPRRHTPAPKGANKENRRYSARKLLEIPKKTPTFAVLF